MRYELNEPSGRDLVFIAGPRPKPDKLVSKIIIHNLDKVEERRSLVRKSRQRWPGVWLALTISPFIPLASQMAPSLLMMMLVCGRPIETEKRQTY